MGKQTRKIQEQEEQFQNEILNQFKDHNKKNKRKIKKETVFDLIQYATDDKTEHSLSECIKSFGLKNPDDFKLIGYNKDRQLKEFIRWMFCKYPVPPFFYSLWAVHPNFKKDINSEFKLWFICLAQGESLYKNFAKGILSKPELNYFLKAPNENNFIQNIWWARARNCGDLKYANIIATSKLIHFRNQLKFDFWKGVIKFFANSDLTRNEFDDIIDYLTYALATNSNFSLKGRTVQSIIRLSNEWHIQETIKKNMKTTRWEGFEIPDWYYKDKKTDEVIWSAKEIKTSSELIKEGNKLRHCVASYSRYIISGECSIISFKKKNEDILGYTFDHTLTLELSKNRHVKQVRGFGNRSPTFHEKPIIRAWAAENNIYIPGYLFI